MSSAATCETSTSRRWPRSRWLWAVLGFGTLTALATTAQPLLVARVVDRLLVGHSILWEMVGLALAAATIVGSELGGKISSARRTKHLADQWRDIIVGRAFPALGVSNRDVVSQSNNDVDAVIATFHEGRAKLVLSVVGVAIAAVGIGSISPIFLALLVVCAGAMTAVPLAFRTSLARRKRDALERTARWNRQLGSTLHGATTLHRRHAMAIRLSTVRRSSRDATAAGFSSEAFQGVVDISIGSILLVNQILVILVGWWLVDLGSISVGDVVAALQFDDILIAPMLTLSDSLTDIAGGRAIGEGLLSGPQDRSVPTPSPSTPSPSTPSPRAATHLVEPAGASGGDTLLRCQPFTHPLGASGEMLVVPALTVHRGDVVLLSGDSGSGKSVLVRLLAGELSSPGARIDLAASTSYVPAEEPSFSAELDHEITLGRDVPDDLVSSLVDIVDSADGRISTMRRLNSVEGASLGEWQRVVLARALVDRPELLILDEALSHLDASSARELLARIGALERPQAVIVVHHGMSANRPAWTRRWRIDVDGTHHVVLDG